MNEVEFIASLWDALWESREQGLLDADVSFDGDHKSAEIIVAMGGKRVVISTEDVEDNTD